MSDEDDDEVEALKEADKMREMKLEGKVNRLVDLAKVKNTIFAIKTAKKLNDACLLDLLHDKLVETGLIK